MLTKIRYFPKFLPKLFRIDKTQFSEDIRNFSSNAVGIIGAPFSMGQPKQGTDRAPDMLRSFGLVKQLQDLDLDVKDYGNIQFDIQDLDKNSIGKIKNPLTVGSACQKVSEGVANILLEKRLCVTLGGDHSLGIGTVYGHSQVHKLCLLWIDAHADINTPCTSPSGNIHGMPLSFLIKELEKYQTRTEGFNWLKPCISKTNVAFIGLRDIDPLEKLILTKEHILHFTMRDIDELGITEVTRRALNSINPSGKLSLHISFDIDSIDMMAAPSTGTPVLGGLTVREALCLAEEVFDSNHPLRALDIVEVNPNIGNELQQQCTINAAILIAKAFLGYSRIGKVPSHMHEIPTH